jgi:hypothetical protein
VGHSPIRAQQGIRAWGYDRATASISPRDSHSIIDQPASPVEPGSPAIAREPSVARARRTGRQITASSRMGSVLLASFFIPSTLARRMPRHGSACIWLATCYSVGHATRPIAPPCGVRSRLARAHDTVAAPTPPNDCRLRTRGVRHLSNLARSGQPDWHKVRDNLPLEAGLS